MIAHNLLHVLLPEKFTLENSFKGLRFLDTPIRN